MLNNTAEAKILLYADFTFKTLLIYLFTFHHHSLFFYGEIHLTIGMYTALIIIIIDVQIFL